MTDIIVGSNEAGQRLDKLLAKYLNQAPKSFIYKMLRKKNIKLNDKKAQGNEILKEKDCIKLFLADETISSFRNESKKAECITENVKLDISKINIVLKNIFVNLLILIPPTISLIKLNNTLIAFYLSLY